MAHTNNFLPGIHKKKTTYQLWTSSSSSTQIQRREKSISLNVMVKMGKEWKKTSNIFRRTCALSPLQKWLFYVWFSSTQFLLFSFLTDEPDKHTHISEFTLKPQLVMPHKLSANALFILLSLKKREVKLKKAAICIITCGVKMEHEWKYISPPTRLHFSWVLTVWFCGNFFSFPFSTATSLSLSLFHP